ncbi:hypothetical protein LOCC1_G004785 [Lachnellula occidentalis]|uniref:Agglutinin-like protein n=1 Tax=Lachnellula occidentalis TaxID=215460 RepID=A0A8H8UH44_9HELO|nr:hypothetical protein LOCC1_G004785 [Lachnellula occidentalis]
MVSPLLLSFYMLWTLCALPAKSLWFRRSNVHLNSAAKGPGETIYNTQGSGPNHNFFTYSVPSPSVITPTLTSQSMIVTSVVAAYEVCNTPAPNTTSTCSTVFRNITTSLCSTVLTAWFTSITVTDCNQNITFSTQSSYSLATATTISSTPPAFPAGQASSQGPTAATFVQSVVSYFIAPWQSLAANTPNNITVLICKFDQDKNKICQEIQEVWVVHTESVPVTSTSMVSVSTSFTVPAVLLLGPSQSITAPKGAFELTTEIEYTSLSANGTTFTSTISESGTLTSAPLGAAPSQSETSTTTSTTTITILGKPTTTTRTLTLVIESKPTAIISPTSRNISTGSMHPLP